MNNTVRPRSVNSADFMPFAIAMFAGLAACVNLPKQATITAAPLDAGIELPPGPGREHLMSACLSCHDLGGLGLFKDFYTRDSWKVLVLTMIEHGAELEATEVELVSDYLAEHFGPDR